MNPRRVHLRLQAQSTVFGFDDGRAVELPIGPQGLTRHALRHEPPTAAELERAIDLVEDALARWPGDLSASRELVTADPLLRALPGLDQPGSTLGRDAVEALFQRLASRALGTPVAEAELPNGGLIAAALLILRECMHHLGFERVLVRLA